MDIVDRLNDDELFTDAIDDAIAEIEKLRHYTATLEALLEERDRVVEAIPPCPVHGRQCVPHALDWVSAQQS